MPSGLNDIFFLPEMVCFHIFEISKRLNHSKYKYKTESRKIAAIPF